jgi:predicted permease
MTRSGKGGRAGGAGAARRRLQRALIVVEIALTFALLCGAGLVLRSLLRVEQLPLGFDPRDVLVFRMVVPDALTGAQRGAFYEEVAERLRHLPGVSQVGVISNIFTSSEPNATVRIEGRSDRTLVSTAIADDSASPELFSLLRTPLKTGRFFSETDRDKSPAAAIVNETFARHFWSGESAIGKRFQFLDGRFGDRWVTVVGVIADMRRNGLEQVPFPQVFVPFAQLPSRGADLAVLTAGDPAALTRSVRTIVAEINPDVPVYRMSTLQQRVDAFLSSRRFQTLMLSLLAGAGLLLAAVGLFGLMRYMVAQRTREIGVRVAIGATRTQVIGLVVRESLALTGAGLIVGLILAFALTRSLSRFLYGVSASDPVTFLLAPAVLLFVAVVASVEPTWRAMRVDPVTALRSE